MPLKNILLAYQLENYKSLRFLKFIYSHPKFWLFGSQRQELVWTAKAKVLFLLSIILVLCDILGVFFILGNTLISYLILVIILWLTPLYFAIAHFLISPLDWYLKKQIIEHAKTKLASYKDLKIIAITGSYAKTSTKEILATLLREKLEVIAPEGTKNTMLGTSEVIEKQLTDKTDVLIVEMGAYKKGDIRELCDFVHPNISILTGITLQHLERFGNLENIQDAKFEIFEGLEENDLAIIDISSQGAKQAYEKKKGGLTTKNITLIDDKNIFTYLPNYEGIEFEINGKKYTTKLIAKHSINTIKIAYEVAKKLGLSEQEIERGISKISYVKHRMEVIRNPLNNSIIIDDSFNGNIEGVNSIIDALKNIPEQGRKVLILGGIVELGEKLAEVNKKIGKQFAQVADIVLLSKGPVGEALESGLLEGGLKKESIKVYPHSLDIHKDLPNVLKPGDIVVFQNDLPDNYL